MKCWHCGNTTRAMYFQGGEWQCVNHDACDAEAEISVFFARARLPQPKRPVLTLIPGGLHEE